jgi:hypothetical protein
VAELVDAQGRGPWDRKVVGVQLPPSVPPLTDLIRCFQETSYPCAKDAPTSPVSGQGRHIVYLRPPILVLSAITDGAGLPINVEYLNPFSYLPCLGVHLFEVGEERGVEGLGMNIERRQIAGTIGAVPLGHSAGVGHEGYEVGAGDRAAADLEDGTFTIGGPEEGLERHSACHLEAL